MEEFSGKGRHENEWLSGGRIFALLAGCYILLTIFYAWMGYLNNPAHRVLPYDSVFYFMYVRSVVMDFDLNFTNEITRLLGPAYVDQLRMAVSGLPENQYAVGAAIFWAPFFLLAHLATLCARMFGSHLAADGYSSLYQLFVWVANSFYTLLGFVFVSKILKRYASGLATLLACLAVMFATQWTYTVWSYTPYAHNVSFFCVALFLYCLLEKKLHWTTAVCAGLMFLTRWQDILYAAAAVVYSVHLLWRDRRVPGAFGKWLKTNVLFVLVFLVTITPQMIIWNAIYGSPITVPPKVQTFSFFSPHLLGTLFSYSNHHGLFAWHPVLLLGALGLLLLWKRSRLLLVCCLAAVGLEIYFVASLGSMGSSFGNRFLTGALPFFALGLALGADALRPSKALLSAAVGVLLLLAVWNQIFIFQYAHSLISQDGRLSFKEYFWDKLNIRNVTRAQAAYENGRAAHMQGNNAAFYHFSQQACVLQPDKQQYLLALGLASLLTNQFDTGLNAFGKLRTVDPDDPVYGLGLAYFLMATSQTAAMEQVLQGMPEIEAGLFRQRLQAGTSPLDEEYVTRIYKKLSQLG